MLRWMRDDALLPARWTGGHPINWCGYFHRWTHTFTPHLRQPRLSCSHSCNRRCVPADCDNGYSCNTTLKTCRKTACTMPTGYCGWASRSERGLDSGRSTPKERHARGYACHSMRTHWSLCRVPHSWYWDWLSVSLCSSFELPDHALDCAEDGGSVDRLNVQIDGADCFQRFDNFNDRWLDKFRSRNPET